MFLIAAVDTGMNRDFQLTQWTFAAAKGHPALRLALDYLRGNIADVPRDAVGCDDVCDDE